MAAGSNASTNLLDPLKVLWRRRWVIIAAVIIAVVGMAAVDSIRTPVYRATGSLQFTDKAALAGRGIQTDAFLVNSSAVTAAASKAIGQPAPKVQVVINPGTTVANIFALASNPVLSSRIVNAYIQGYIQVQSDKAQYYQLSLEQSLRKRIDALTTQINDYSYQIAVQPKGSAEQQTTQGILGVAVNKRTALQAQLYALQTQSPTSAGVQVSNSLPPFTPISPKPTSDIL
ncbi:MAG: Wzz/FepE/Etk N-terminal domain-containing protein, partial [Actinomycetes bacterium]